MHYFVSLQNDSVKAENLTEVQVSPFFNSISYSFFSVLKINRGSTNLSQYEKLAFTLRFTQENTS